MIDLSDIIRQLTSNADAMRALAQSLSDEQAQWKPNQETWSMKEVMEHIYNEEQMDFRKHLNEMLKDPPDAWSTSDPKAYVVMESCSQVLEGFLLEREASIAWLMTLESPDWNTASETPFDSGGSPLILRAGDVLVSWVEHDFLHLRQMIELLYAWNEKQASPYSVEYAGGW